MEVVVVGGWREMVYLSSLHCHYQNDSRLLYYFIREIKTWLNINHVMVHNNALLYRV